jgi:hypothetical protein
MAREATSNTHIRFPRFSHPSDDTARIGARSSGLSNPADDVEPRSSESHTANASLSQWYDFEFERELFQSSVYSRNVQRTASVSTTRSTITAHTCSILSHLSLADVSVVSVLRLPVETRKLSNESSYDLQRRRSEVSRTGPARLQQSATPQECGNLVRTSLSLRSKRWSIGKAPPKPAPYSKGSQFWWRPAY